MTLFFALSACMVLLSVAWMLVGLFRQQADNVADQLAVNVSIARERQLTLRDALDRGDIDQATYEQERVDLERSLAVDLGTSSATEPAAVPDRNARRGALSAAAVVALLIPLASGVLYLQLGMPRALDSEFVASTRAAAPGSQAQGDAVSGQEQAQAPTMESLLPQLEQKLAENPDDATGWALLGRTRLSLGQFDPAVEAFRRADTLQPNNPAVLASLAEASAMSVGGALQGEPESYLAKALEIEPTHPQALWLMAIAHQQSGRYEQAVTHFDRLLQQVGSDTEARSAIEQMRAESAAAMGNDTAPVAPGDGTAPQRADARTDARTDDRTVDGGDDAASRSAEAGGEVGISVRVSLGTAAAEAVAADQTVFVYARASEGPPMPLAVQRLTVADLPADVTLDDSMAMMPNMAISSFDSLIVGARVSASGNAVGQPGDWIAEQDSVASDTGETLELVIDQAWEQRQQ